MATGLVWLVVTTDGPLLCKVQFGSVQFSCSVVSDYLRPRESQHARPPRPSQTPGVHSDSSPSSQWCHPAISSSGVPFSSCPQSPPASESWTVKKAEHRRIDALKRIYCKEIQPAHSDGDQPWDFFGGNDAEAETPVLWPPHVKSWLIGKDSDAGRDWGQEEKAMTEDEVVGWHHWLNGHEFEQALRESGGQKSLVHCSPWGHKESDTTATEKQSALFRLIPIDTTPVQSWFPHICVVWGHGQR